MVDIQVSFGLDETFAELEEGIRKRIAEMIEERVEALVLVRTTEIARRMTQAIEGGQIGVYEIDLSVGIATGTPRFNNLFGYPADQPGISTEQWIARVHPEDLEAATDHMRRLLRSATEANTGEYRVLINGQTRWLMSCDRIERNAEGRALFARGTVQDITERKIFEQRMWHAAHHDPLTGLPNRIEFAAALRRALVGAESSEQRVGVAMFDLDGLKAINDGWGHQAGDEVLVAVAKGLASAASSVRGTAARLGGDEFGIVLSDVEPEAMATFLSSTAAALRSTVRFGTTKLAYSVSAGGAVLPINGPTLKNLLRNADVALCQAKKLGPAQWLLYSD